MGKRSIVVGVIAGCGGGKDAGPSQDFARGLLMKGFGNGKLNPYIYAYCRTPDDFVVKSMGPREGDNASPRWKVAVHEKGTCQLAGSPPDSYDEDSMYTIGQEAGQWGVETPMGFVVP